jgi:predicted HTH domain antitoxin
MRGVKKPKKRFKDKVVKERVHAKRRAKERYGIELNASSYEEINNIIRTGNAKLLKKQSLTRKLYEVRYRGILLKVAYDKARGQVVTFLPLQDKYE